MRSPRTTLVVVLALAVAGPALAGKPPDKPAPPGAAKENGVGCRFALDDFGTDLGGFANLKQLPMDYLKIDGSFMRDLGRDSVNQGMVTAVVGMARTLNFRLVAEQVEDLAALEAARAMGIDFVQGHAIGRPRPLAPAA